MRDDISPPVVVGAGRPSTTGPRRSQMETLALMAQYGHRAHVPTNRSRGWWAFAHHDGVEGAALRFLSREAVTHELDKQRIQILPPRIELLDQPDLPRPAPAFDRLLPLDSRDDLLMALEVDQSLQPVSLSKTGNRPYPVLINPPKHIPPSRLRKASRSVCST